MDESCWDSLTGGYRIPYDPRPALAQLRNGNSAAWDELWQELHHQGDVGVASYAAVPRLLQIHADRDVADWQTYALIGVIETCRTHTQNPPLPDWLAAEYTAAWEAVVPLACRICQGRRMKLRYDLFSAQLRSQRASVRSAISS